MARDRAKFKGRAERGSFVALPHNLLEHPNFTRLSARAVKLLVDIAFHYRGQNNGNLAATWNTMSKRGWKSRETLALAIAELIHFGWIKETRKGGIRIPTLYALTFHPVNECKIPLDVPTSATASHEWKQPREPWIEPTWYSERKKRKPKTKSFNTDTDTINTDSVSMEGIRHAH